MNKFKVTSIKTMDKTQMTFPNMCVVDAPRYFPSQMLSGGRVVNPCLAVKAVKPGDNPAKGVFTFRLWGELADDAAKKLGKGNRFSAVARAELYTGRVWDEEGNVLTKKDGSPITVQKACFVASTIMYH